MCEAAGQCRQPFGLDSTGFPTYDPRGALVWWPECPRQWDVGYQFGIEVIPPAEYYRWHCEIGTHRLPGLSSGAVRLFREYTRVRDFPAKLAKERRIEEKRLKDGHRR